MPDKNNTKIKAIYVINVSASRKPYSDLSTRQPNAMPYITRDENGKIIRASTKHLVGGELVSHAHPDIMDFLTARGQNPSEVEKTVNELRQTDADMARTIEDVIMVLLKKNLMKMSDLPKIAQDRLANRVKLRVVLEDMYDQASGSKPS